MAKDWSRILADRDRRFIRQWRKLRTRGFWPYTLTVGLIWGLASATIVVLLLAALGEQDLEPYALQSFIGFPITGILLFGPAMWWSSHRKYRKIKRRTLGTDEMGAT